MIIVIAAMLLGALATERAVYSRGDISSPEGLIQDCPEHWYVNHMPGYGAPDGPRAVSDEYFVYKGMRQIGRASCRERV